MAEKKVRQTDRQTHTHTQTDKQTDKRNKKTIDPDWVGDYKQSDKRNKKTIDPDWVGAYNNVSHCTSNEQICRRSMQFNIIRWTKSGQMTILNKPSK